MFQGGYLTLARVRGALIRMHYSAPIGAVLFGRFEFVPGFWLAFINLIMVHELGHAVMVWACRARVVACDVTGLGGTCTYEGDVSDVQDALIAWGGVIAQMVVYIIALLLVSYAPPETAYGAQIASACLSANVWLAVMNLMPVRPLDGADAWRLFPLLWRRFRRNRTATKVKAARRTTAKIAAHDELLRLEDLDAEPEPEADAAVDAAVDKILRDANARRPP